VRLAVNVVAQNNGDFMGKIMLQLTWAAQNSPAGRLSVAGCRSLTYTLFWSKMRFYEM
jgi:hypothetical protein